MTTTQDRDLEKRLQAAVKAFGADFSSLPPILTPKEAACLLGISVDALSQDRVGGNPTIPYAKFGRRVRYLKNDILRHLLANRIGGAV